VAVLLELPLPQEQHPLHNNDQEVVAVAVVVAAVVVEAAAVLVELVTMVLAVAVGLAPVRVIVELVATLRVDVEKGVLAVPPVAVGELESGHALAAAARSITWLNAPR
jgi:uncharacterized membrane protein YGL010W